MERKEAYSLIKEYGLEEEVVNRFGTNYTRTTTAKLEEIIADYLKENEEEEEEENTANSENEAQEVETAYEAACLTFLGILEDSGLLEGLLKKL